MNELIALGIFAAGCAMGGMLAWIFLRGHARQAASAIRTELDPQLAARNQQIVDLQAAGQSLQIQLSQVTTLLQSQSTACATAEEKARMGNELLSTVQAEQSSLREQLSVAKDGLVTANAQVKILEEKLTTERQQIEQIQQKFQSAFEAISNKLLVDNSNKFSQQTSDSLANLLQPLKQSLGDFKTSLDTTRTETATHSALLKEQISRIGAEATNLSKALKGDVKVLGNWGENMLDQILEKSGLQRDLHYKRQRGAKDPEGGQRYLDVIVDLPEKQSLVIDSKVSLRSYEESVNTLDEAAQLIHLNNHVDALRAHFRELGAKRYQDIYGINTPEFVLMYMPIEAAFIAAIRRVPGLFAEALDKNVILTTNSTLLATLHTVAHVWKLADQQKNAQEIADRGGKLYDKFVGFVDDLQNVGKALKTGQEAWELASNKLHTGAGNLLRQAEQLKKLGVKATKALPAPLIEKSGDSESSPVALPPPAMLPPPEPTGGAGATAAIDQ